MDTSLTLRLTSTLRFSSTSLLFIKPLMQALPFVKAVLPHYMVLLICHRNVPIFRCRNSFSVLFNSVTESEICVTQSLTTTSCLSYDALACC
ncbi:hypothetical protein SESBI_27552 [Sesbania bispinosa]|nr:hypothetical protein SESBI_27552 [Sesbania bispinosa]